MFYFEYLFTTSLLFIIDDLENYDSREVTCGSEYSSRAAPETTSSSDQSTHKDASSRKGSNETLAFSPLLLVLCCTDNNFSEIICY